MRDPIVDDFVTLNHEVGHAVTAVVLGRSLLRVIGHWHQRRDENERGSVEWIGQNDDPFGEAVILVAGRTAAEGIHAPGDTSDERQARDVCPLGFDRARTEAFIILSRRDVQAARSALCDALEANRYVLSGVDAERVVHACLRQR